MSNDITIDRLSAYLDDELAPDEREELDRLLLSSESLREELNTLRQVRDWFRDYPGRKPRKDAWLGIAARISATDVSTDGVWQETPKPERRRTGFMGFLPAFAWAGSATAMKRLGIGALVAVALGGMGRQFVLEQRADDLEQISVLRDMQLFEYANAAKWYQNAVEFREQAGLRLSLACPPQGQLGAIWGTGVYTDDSSICSAAVHSGVITQEHGGLVTIEVQDGLPGYRGSSNNGVESRSFGEWGGSFGILANDRRPIDVADLDAGTVSWDDSALNLRGLNGTFVKLSCPAGGENRGPIFGTDTYTDDSSICTAAVHAGIITYEDGGDVTIEIVPGVAEYQGTSRNGVASLDYSEWSGSFVFVDAESMFSEQARLTRSEQRDQYRRQQQLHAQAQTQARAQAQAHAQAQVQVQAQAQAQVQAQAQLMVDADPSVVVGVDSEHRLIQKLTVDLDEIGWGTDALEMTDWVGFQADLTCPPDGSPADVWGTDAYTASSSICTAAAHVGLITLEDGGPITIEVVPGLSVYEGSTRNGVTSKTSRSSAGGSGCFRFVRN